MYIGSTGERGLHHLIWEIVDNAVDEALAGHCDRIVVTLQADGAIRVEDNGRGIPTDTAPGQELPALTMALTDAARRRQVRRRRLQGLRRSARRRRLGRQRAVEPPDRRGPQPRPPVAPDLHHRRPRRRARAGPRDGARRAHRHHDHLLGLPGHLRDHDVLPRDDHLADPRVRLPQQGPRDRRARRAPGGRRDRSTPSRTTPSPTRSTGRRADAIKRGESGGIEQVFKYDRGLVDYVEHLNRRKTGREPDDHLLRGRDPRRRSRTT